MRVELSKGNWAEVRDTMTVADLKFQRETAHAREYEDPVLDMIALFPRLITSWSLGDVNDDTVAALSTKDMAAIRDALNADESPNGSTPSSAGTSRARARNRSKG